MTILATSTRCSEEASASIALRRRVGLIDRLILLLRRRIRQEEKIVASAFIYYPIWIGTAEIRFSREATSAPGESVLFAIDGLTGLVSRISGHPHSQDISSDYGRVVACRIAGEEAKRILSTHLQQRLALRSRRVPQIAIKDLNKIYKPYYVFQIEAGRKSTFRAVDAEIGIREYSLDIRFQDLAYELPDS